MCWATTILSFGIILPLIGAQSFAMLAFELFWVFVARRGLGATKRIILPIYRKFLFVYVVFCILTWVLVFIRSKLGQQLGSVSDRTKNYQNSTYFLTEISRWVNSMGFVVSMSMFSFVATASAGADAIIRLKQVAIGGALTLTSITGLAIMVPTVRAPAIIATRICFLIAMTYSVLYQTFQRWHRKKAQRYAAVILFAVFVPSSSFDIIWSADFIFGTTVAQTCEFNYALVLVAVLTPIGMYTAFRVDSAHWRRVTRIHGLLHPQAESVARLLVEQYFPSHLLLDYNAFELEIELGSGAQASVYKTRHRRQHTYALKRYHVSRLTENVVENFLGEALILSQMPHHENITSIKGVCVSPPYLCIVTELCDESLFSYLERHRRRGAVAPIKDRMLLAHDIVKGMHFLHSLSPAIIHRDLKSLNVLLKFSSKKRRPIAKVADMGCSRLFDSSTSFTQTSDMAHRIQQMTAKIFSSSPTNSSFGTLTGLTGRVGTVPWCAPEVLRLETYCEKCDVFSMGVVLWELVTGLEPAYKGRIFSHQCMRGFRLSLEDVQPDLAHVIAMCWHETPAMRPTFAQLLDSMETILAKLEDGRISVTSPLPEFRLSGPVVTSHSYLHSSETDTDPSYSHTGTTPSFTSLRRSTIDFGKTPL